MTNPTICETDLNDILQKFIKFGDFKLRGKKSNYYIDIKSAVTNPRILKLLAYMITRKMIIEKMSPDYIGCIEVGSIPIGTIVSIEAELPLIIIRKAEKKYGIEGRIIGYDKKAEKEKEKVVLLIEDVVTTGGNAIDAVNVLREKDLIVRDVITVVDRDEGGKEQLYKEGINLTALFSAKELLNSIKKNKI